MSDRYDVQQKKHELYVIEPSGVMYRYFGAAVGKGRQVCPAFFSFFFCDTRTHPRYIFQDIIVTACVVAFGFLAGCVY